MKHTPELSVVAGLLAVASAEAHRLCLVTLTEPSHTDALSLAEAAEVCDASFQLFPLMSDQCNEPEIDVVDRALERLSPQAMLSQAAAYFVNCLESARCLLLMSERAASAKDDNLLVVE